jgi:acetyl-CoA carboxylase beta subunit
MKRSFVGGAWSDLHAFEQMDVFSSATSTARIDAILDAGTFEPRTKGRAAIITGSGCVGAVPVWVAASDPVRARGAIGNLEADALCSLFEASRLSPRPLVLLLDSSGAKVDEGITGLGAFRRLFRAALTTRAAGIPMLALLGRSCFGGASLLACLCNARAYSEETLLAVSGPAVIEALGGESELRANNREQVRALMGGATRSRMGASELLLTDNLSAFRTGTMEWLRAGNTAVRVAPATTSEHERLGERLDASNWTCDAALTARARTQFQSIAPAGYGCRLRGCVVVGEPPLGSQDPALIGVLTGATVGADACWILADELLGASRLQPERPITLLLDATGHAATYRDEAFMLSAYLAHLSVVIAESVASGQRIELRIAGAAAGAVYVAFAAAGRVAAYPRARVRVLPEAAVRRIVGQQRAEDASMEALLAAGVIDEVIDDDSPGDAVSLSNVEVPR